MYNLTEGARYISHDKANSKIINSNLFSASVRTFPCMGMTYTGRHFVLAPYVLLFLAFDLSKWHSFDRSSFSTLSYIKIYNRKFQVFNSTLRWKFFLFYLGKVYSYSMLVYFLYTFSLNNKLFLQFLFYRNKCNSLLVVTSNYYLEQLTCTVGTCMSETILSLPYLRDFYGTFWNEQTFMCKPQV